MTFYDTVYNDDDKYVREIERLKKSQQEKQKKIDELFKQKKNEYSQNFTRSFKRKIIERDKECQLCGKKEDLVVHHISYNRRKTDKNECVTLCRSCNCRVNKKSEREYWRNYFVNKLHYQLNR